MITIKFPITFTQGKSDIANTLTSIQQSILQRLMTKQGSIFFDRSYGSRLYELLFEKNDLVRKSLAYTFCREALQGEQRIRLRVIEISQENEIMELRINYTLTSNNEIQTIIFEI